jgi:hypothetical protein
MQLCLLECLAAAGEQGPEDCGSAWDEEAGGTWCMVARHVMVEVMLEQLLATHAAAELKL